MRKPKLERLGEFVDRLGVACSHEYVLRQANQPGTDRFLKTLVRRIGRMKNFVAKCMVRGIRGTKDAS